MAHIAIIGTGISGLSSAYLLQQAGHDIAVYERDARPGGHTRTLNIDYDGTKIAVDTGFIVFNNVNYPHLSALFRHLGVAVQKSDMTLAVTIDRGRFEWGARDINSIFGQRSNIFNPYFYWMLRDVIRFNKFALATVERLPDLTLGELLSTLKLGSGFKRYYLLPMGGAIWSCPPSAMLGFSAKQFVQFFKNHGLLSFTGQHQWYTVSGGSQNYVDRLMASFHDRVRLDCAAVRVKRDDKGVDITDSRGETKRYDRVVFACHADEALAMLDDADTHERSLLGAFQYQKNIAYLHRDESFMPKRKACWASWVYQASGWEKVGQEPQIGITYWMNLLQSIPLNKPLFVTLNPTRDIDAKYVFDRHEFHHPIFSRATSEAQIGIKALQGNRNSWFCGAYMRHGFHEDGLQSAVDVAESMGARIPWR